MQLFPGFGTTELILVLVIVLIIFGVGKLPQIGGAIGKSIKEFRKARSDEEEDKNKVKTITTSDQTDTKEKG